LFVESYKACGGCDLVFVVDWLLGGTEFIFCAITIGIKPTIKNIDK
jgi:hypothetical protein